MPRQMSVRELLPGEWEKLVPLKKDYLWTVYRGYIAEDAIQRNAEEYVTQVMRVIRSDATARACAVYENETMRGYLIYNEDARDPGESLILDYAFEKDVQMQEKHLLIEWYLHFLRDRHIRRVGVWIVKDNLRSRFFFENIGFRRQGDPREIIRAGKTIAMIYYQYEMMQQETRQNA